MARQQKKGSTQNKAESKRQEPARIYHKTGVRKHPKLARKQETGTSQG